MNAFEKFLKILDGKMVEPLAYGWFHLMCWGNCYSAHCLFMHFRFKEQKGRQKQ